MGRELTHELLLESLDYDEVTGKFTWKLDRPLDHFKDDHAKKSYLGKFAGKEAGYVQNYSGDLQYRQIRLFEKLYLGHRLAWFYIYGKWPEGIIDHKDGVGLNNSKENLRDVDHPTNGRNSKKSKNNTSGVNGVYWHKQCLKWCAEGHYTEGGVNKKKYLGLFESLEEAATVRQEWQEEQGNFSERHGE